MVGAVSGASAEAVEGVHQVGIGRGAVADVPDDRDRGPVDSAGEVHLGVHREACEQVAAKSLRVVGGREHAVQAAQAVGQGGVEHLLADAPALEAGAHRIRRQDPGALAPHARGEPDHARTVVVGDPTSAGVGVQEVSCAGDPAGAVGLGTRCRVGLVAAKDAVVELGERLVGELLGDSYVLTSHRADDNRCG